MPARGRAHLSFVSGNYLQSKDTGMVRGFATTLLLASVLSGMTAAQSAPSLKDIPAIAKAAKGAIVTIVTATTINPSRAAQVFL